MHYCKDCREKFDKPIEYFNHRKREHPRYTCPDCGKVFGFRKKLVYHLRACPRSRRHKMRHESGSVISFSNYKRLPIFSAKELDVEFEIYMDRKFGKKGTFRNKKMCKFCCKTFTFASDFADHIRDHYKSIPLDATGVKSKFDFMNFMGLKIRETTGTDYSDETKNKITECRVVIIGEHCKICSESFKCRTDLEHHNKVYHPPYNSDEVMLVLRIGKEVMARIPVEKRHLTRVAETCQSNSLAAFPKYEDRERSTEDEWPDREPSPLLDNRPPRIPTEKEMAAYDLGSSERIYADEFCDGIEFAEPWKEELETVNTSWYSELKLRGDTASDGEDCYCIGAMRPRLTPKKPTEWEQEHFNNMLTDEGETCLDLSLHESPPIYKYSCDRKYQADFSFPSDEKSYGFEVKTEDSKETNNNEEGDNFNVDEPFDYKGAIIVKEERTKMINRTRSVPYQCEDHTFGFEDLESGKPVADAMDNYQEVLIKEEVMLDDCTYCINDAYPSLSYRA